MGGDHDRWSMIGKEGEVKEKERQQLKKKRKLENDMKTLLFIYKRLHLSAGLP